MKYKDQKELVDGLRELADFIEKKGLELPFTYYSTPVSIVQRFYADDNDSDGKVKQILAKAARTMGKAEKRIQFSDYEVIKKFGRLVELRFETSRENVCVRRVVGTKEIPKRVFVDIPGETVTEEIVEWDCPPALLSNL